MSDFPTTARSDGAAEFPGRHIGPSPAERAAMLEAIGATDLDELIGRTVPPVIRTAAPLDLPEPLSEADALARLRDLAGQNRTARSLLGLGYHDTFTPLVIQRNLLENPAWYTAYTPYQPEISQGRLEALLNFQTMVSDLTAMDIANASLLDEPTAAAEAMTLLHRVNREVDGNTFVVDAACHPQTIAVVATRAQPLGIEIVVGDPLDLPDDGVFGVLVQYPGTTGELRDLSPIVEAAHARDAMVAVAADLLALTVVEPPGEAGADVVVGSAQRFGVPLGFGGPHAGYIAVRDDHRRSLPGRLVGVSVDSEGRPALRLALQTREQHIRRERATSNICTAEVLLAVIAGMYAVYHGPDGLRAIADRTHGLATRLAQALRTGGLEVVHEHFFDTVAVRVPGRADQVLAAALTSDVNLRRVDADTVVVAFDETSTAGLVDTVLGAFGIEPDPDDAVPVSALHRARTSPFCTHEVFHSHRSETAMMRYLRRLADRDLALDRTMIPLGSCTMKLNAVVEMQAVTWPEFAGIHPFAPLDQAAGYMQLISELEAALVEITGYDAVSLQPNAGSQGELAGLLAIRGHHRSRGEHDRRICLIPSSAHGTNAASAVMAGMDVVVVATDEQGDVDLDDLQLKAVEHADDLAALMVTYPSTHGVFESHIVEICDLVHQYGGQVYLDGANLNAMVGLAKPGEFGADVSHLNLHKTFCIPHGGGGPGVGPVAVREHLAPFLPNHPLVPEAGPATGPGPISGAPWGSAGILPISWAYIALMGGAGLTEATEVAILSANYLARRLADHYPILYTGGQDTVAHECILDLRPLKEATGVTVDDVAKRLVDYGFHAPTMSFPVPGTLMVEPTESEDLAELDRFCDAMIAIRGEIDEIGSGAVAVDDSALRHSPHPAVDVVADDWDRRYSRRAAAYPDGVGGSVDKYWPPVSRIDGAYGDKNLMCSCPPIEDIAVE